MGVRGLPASLRARCWPAALSRLWLPAAAGGVNGKPRPTVDRTPPSQPTNLRVVGVTQTSVTLAWSPSTDNVGVTTYSLWGEGLSGVVSATHPNTTATWTYLLGPARP